MDAINGLRSTGSGVFAMQITNCLWSDPAPPRNGPLRHRTRELILSI